MVFWGAGVSSFLVSWVFLGFQSCLFYPKGSLSLLLVYSPDSFPVFGFVLDGRGYGDKVHYP